MYRNLAEAFGWTPEQIGRMTPAQLRMYADTDKPKRQDDWSQFGLYLDDDGRIKAPNGREHKLREYHEYRKSLKE